MKGIVKTVNNGLVEMDDGFVYKLGKFSKVPVPNQEVEFTYKSYPGKDGEEVRYLYIGGEKKVWGGKSPEEQKQIRRLSLISTISKFYFKSQDNPSGHEFEVRPGVLNEPVLKVFETLVRRFEEIVNG